MPTTTLLPLASVRLTLMPTTVMAATARGPLTPRLMPTMAMEAMVDMDSAMEATAMAVLATATARGLPTQRLMPTTAMEAMVDTVSATPLATVLATAMAVTAMEDM